MKKYFDVSPLIHFNISGLLGEICNLPQSQIQKQRGISSIRQKIYTNIKTLTKGEKQESISPTLSTARKQLVQEVTEEINAIFKAIPELKDHLSDRIDLERIGRGLDILGRGMMGIVFLDEEANAIIKIGRNIGSHQELAHERIMHDIFREILEIEKEKGNIPQWIQIPIIQSERENPVYIMEKITGYSLNKIDFLTNPLFAEHRKYLAQELALISTEASQTISPENIDFVLTQFIKTISESELDKLQKKVFDHLPKPEGVSIMAENIIQRIFPQRYEAFHNALTYLEEKGIEHGDLHSGNCFIDNKDIIDIIKNIQRLQKEDFSIYIIDFGMTDIERDDIKKNYPELLFLLPNDHE